MGAYRIHYTTAETWMAQNVSEQNYFGHEIWELYRIQHIEGVVGHWRGHPYVSPLRVVFETLGVKEYNGL